jgi:hypothetical protein
MKAEQGARRHESKNSHGYENHHCDIIAIHPNCREARGRVK